MPYYEVLLFRQGSDVPFLSSPRMTALAGSFNVGDTLAVGLGPSLVIGAIAHRWLPGPNNEPLMQTALVLSTQGAGLVEVAPAPWIAPSGDFVPWPWLADAGGGNPGARTLYEGIGTTIEAALLAAHARIPMRPHRDFTTSKVVGWGMQRGGLTDQSRFYVQVEEDPDARFRSDGGQVDAAANDGSVG